MWIKDAIHFRFKQRLNPDRIKFLRLCLNTVARYMKKGLLN